ncbi:AMP-binding protein [Frankia sp. CNm7]|uniref:AMP-binding protein n=1 Tax=Frankia nepalensis TaxID=1836974 RepID=A0A937UQ66_9ACTN|nr:AMP-binding protein [Frankia nepalensis]MBL7500115.1 AMP-binding protein [Frankia nepalensis]MBL7512930.1 AMP-binding protein [Frankia nepalensis]MBL7521664.1 AMP-binding protein [Frankia nepalensis]MBL7631559.1 AMP-binding protein [Frankia nepalensis]
MTTVAELLRQRAEGDGDGAALLIGEERWTYAQLLEEATRRAALFDQLRDPGRPPHIGVLLENVPDYVFWLGAAALSGAVVVGINATYRGDQLGQLVRHTDCQLLVTSAGYQPLLAGVDTGVPADRVLVVDGAEYAERLAASPLAAPDRPAREDDLFLLIFTSGSTGLPKAVRCTQGRFARTGAHVARIAELGAGDVVYSSLPFFHSSSLFTGWSSALNAGIPISTRPRFSASNTLPDIRRFGATMITYTGKVLNYIVATPERPDDADSPLRLAVGNEASVQDIRQFARRFGCAVRDSYGSTEGIIIIRRDPAMPDGALGTADPTVKVLDPDTGLECPPVVLGPDGRPANLDEAVGEIVETAPAAGFEGYYNNEEATRTRFRDGRYWSGDLAYRDGDGWLYFAGRSNEWLRVDGENFAAAPVEAILSRHPDVRSVAVYAVPDDPVGDRVMVALELRGGARFDPARFDAFLAEQTDLGPKWLPAFVRVTEELPKLASMKIDKMRLRREAWRPDGVVWRPAKGEPLRPLDEADRTRLEPLLG